MDVAVVGGGLAGLVAALDLARGGHAVTLFEKSRALGGRAQTTRHGEYAFNLGPHALYRRGAAARAFRQLGIPVEGGRPAVNGGYALQDGRAHTLPVGAVSLLTTGLLRLPAKLELARILAAPPRDVAPLRGLTVAEWLARQGTRPETREYLAALLRLTTYAHDPSRQGAAAALAQFRLGLHGVLYLDGGWQALVDALADRGRAAGVRFVAGAAVRTVEHDAAVRGVRLADGSHHAASAVVLATSPAAADALVPGAPVLARWAEEAIPVRAASLDVALSGLPRPHARFALGVDTPIYLSVHSAVARLAPEGGALVHVAKYLGSAVPADPEAVEAELLAALDLVQPGWRTRVVHRRFLSNLLVANALDTPAGRPGPEVPGVAGLFVAGDWVGPTGMLADASVASARLAAVAALSAAPRRSASLPAAREALSA